MNTQTAFAIRCMAMYGPDIPQGAGSFDGVSFHEARLNILRSAMAATCSTEVCQEFERDAAEYGSTMAFKSYVGGFADCIKQGYIRASQHIADFLEVEIFSDEPGKVLGGMIFLFTFTLSESF
jgi:hypothetical protein